MATNATLEGISPFFIVDNLAESIDFYNQNSVLRQICLFQKMIRFWHSIS